MKKYIIIILILICLFYLYDIIIKYKSECSEKWTNIDSNSRKNEWSEKWTKIDFEARKNDSCKVIQKEYKKLGMIDTWIWTMDKTCENGLPHTRDYNIMAIPENYPIYFLPKTIEHEKIHLHQRRNINDWKKFYKIYWDYEIFEKPPQTMPLELIEMKRANPDTNDAPFSCWKHTWWAVPVYKSLSDLKFINCIIKWWNEKTNEIFTDPPDEWIHFFGSNVYQTEHPHEISAVYIANILFGNYDESIKGMNILNEKWDSINEKFR
jgi:hypothetical protein